MKSKQTMFMTLMFWVITYYTCLAQKPHLGGTFVKNESAIMHSEFVVFWQRLAGLSTDQELPQSLVTYCLLPTTFHWQEKRSMHRHTIRELTIEQMFS